MMGTGTLLLAASAGYWVVLQAEGRKRGLRRLGRWLGGAVIVISLIGVFCQLAYGAAGACPWSGKKTCLFQGSRASALSSPALP